MEERVVKFISSCKKCRRLNKHKIMEKLMRSVKADLPMDHLVLDPSGELPSTIRGNNHLLVVVDVATRYVWLYAIQNLKSHTIAECLVDIVSRFGLFKRIGSDNASYMIGDVMNDFKEIFKVEKEIIHAYMPSSNGLVENMLV